MLQTALPKPGGVHAEEPTKPLPFESDETPDAEPTGDPPRTEAVLQIDRKLKFDFAGQPFEILIAVGSIPIYNRID
jgi:hypothetical protein